ncbi:hypothetical protein GCM10008934_18670 [Virgibacillus salarius]
MSVIRINKTPLYFGESRGAYFKVETVRYNGSIFIFSAIQYLYNNLEGGVY